MIKRWVNAWKQARWNKEFERAKFALGLMIANKDPQIWGQIENTAHALAKQMCMQWLDTKKIQHCSLCPNTQPLLYMSGRYLCAPHAELHARQNGAAQKPIEVVS